MEDSYRNNIKWVVFWAICLLGIVIASLMPSLKPPKEYDALLHFICYFALAAVPLARFNGRKAALVCAGSIPVLGLVLEYFQRSIAGREFSPEDMLANNIGTVAGILVGMVLRFIRRISRTPRRLV